MKDETERSIDIDFPVSLRIKMSRLEFCSVMLKLWGTKTIIFLLLLLAVSLILGICSDIKFFILTLMIIFIISPMILGFMYYYYGLGERCYFNVTEHTLEFTDYGIKVNMYFPVITESDDDAEIPEKCVVKSIGYEFLHRYYVGRNCVIFPIGRKRIDGFLWVPETAYSSPEEFVSVVKFLTKHSPEGAY